MTDKNIRIIMETSYIDAIGLVNEEEYDALKKAYDDNIVFKIYDMCDCCGSHTCNTCELGANNITITTIKKCKYPLEINNYFIEELIEHIKNKK